MSNSGSTGSTANSGSDRSTGSTANSGSTRSTANSGNSGWKAFLNFLWDGGFKSLIVLVTLGGALWITVNNDKICKGVPNSNSDSASLVQPNPICSKYFELVFMVVGGYLGLSTPSSTNSNSTTTNTDPKNSNSSANQPETPQNKTK